MSGGLIISRRSFCGNGGFFIARETTTPKLPPPQVRGLNRRKLFFGKEMGIMKRIVQVMLGLMIVSDVFGVITYTGEPEYTAGGGANEATVVIDFDAGDYFVFKYKWDGQATGWDALAAIKAPGALDVQAPWHAEYNSHFVNDFVYPSGEKHDYGEAFAGWGYWGSADGQNWILNTGVDNRQLASGDWDSWVWSNYDTISWEPIRGPGESPVPEPGTISLFCTGIALLLRKRRA
jgi:hypothetical protein